MKLTNVNTDEIAEMTESQAIEQIRTDAEQAGCPFCDGTIHSVSFTTIQIAAMNVTCSNGHRFTVTPFSEN